MSVLCVYYSEWCCEGTKSNIWGWVKAKGMRVSVFVEQMECVIYFMLLPYKNISTIHSDPLL